MNNEELLAQMQKSKIEMIEVDKLVPYARNARTHSNQQVDQIVASLKEFGYTSPILLDGGTEIIAGHGRVMALSKLGVREVPCIRLSHLSEAQKKAYRLADNQLALNSGWDMDLLKIELNDLNGDNFELGLVGFDDSFLNGLMATEPLSDPVKSKGAKELNEDDFQKFDHTCPRCNFEFDD